MLLDEEVGKQLLAELAAMRAELRELRGGPKASGKTLRHLYELHEATWCDESWAMSVRATLRPALRHFADRKADEINRADWIHYRDNVRSKDISLSRRGPNREPRPITVFTLNLEIRRWRSVYRWGIQEGHCSTNPLVDIKAKRGAKKHRETEPTTVDVAALKKFVHADAWAFILLAFQRGFRASEARRLEWRQVDLASGRITLYAHQDKTRRAHVLRVTSDVVAALEAIKPDVPGRYVFQSPRTGHPYHAVTLWRWFREAADQAELQPAQGDDAVVYHDLRHGFMSRATRRHGLPVAMRLSRHRSLAAAERYIHVDDRDLEEAYAKMEEDARRGPKSTDGDKKVPDDDTGHARR